jgi:hypothetical protein
MLHAAVSERCLCDHHLVMKQMFTCLEAMEFNAPISMLTAASTGRSVGTIGTSTVQKNTTMDEVCNI